MPQSAAPARLFADSASPERELRFHSGCRMRKRPRRTGSRTFLHLLECRGKVESSAFRIVSDLVILSLLAAIPSTGIVLHRAHPSRLPFGAQPRRGPDGTPVAMRGNTLRDEGMAACAWRPCRKRNFLLCRNRNFLLCSDISARRDGDRSPLCYHRRGVCRNAPSSSVLARKAALAQLVERLIRN